MKKMLLLLLIIPFFSQAQELLKLTEEGVAPVVVQVEGKTAEELYNKTLDWVNIYYSNPKEVIAGQIKDDYIRIKGYCNDCWSSTSLGISYPYDFTYTLVIEFQDGKYRYAITIEELSTEGKSMAYTIKSFFNKKGVRKLYTDAVTEFELSLNKTFMSHQDYVMDKPASKKDW